MSSHHIVREKQEPALYIDFLGDFDEENLGQLLEWNPTVMVCVDEYEKIISLDLKVDLVVGPAEPKAIQENTVFLPGDKIPVITAMLHFVKEGYPAVNIIGKPFTAELVLPFIDKINMVWFAGATKTYNVKSGFIFWKPANTRLKLQGDVTLQTKNLRVAQNGDYEVISDGFVRIDFIGNNLFVSEYL